MSSYSEYPHTPAAGEPAAPSAPSWPGQPSYGPGQASFGPGQARAREQYGVPDQQYGVEPYLPQPGYPAGVAQPHGQLAVAPRSPAISLIASFFVPGLGSMINNRVGIGILILGIYALGFILAFFIIGVPIAIGAWIWGMVDGYQAAQAWNRAHGIIS
jgi:TM2 domain-containing membrane protein YozV